MSCLPLNIAPLRFYSGVWSSDFSQIGHVVQVTGNDGARVTRINVGGTEVDGYDLKFIASVREQDRAVNLLLILDTYPVLQSFPQDIVYIIAWSSWPSKKEELLRHTRKAPDGPEPSVLVSRGAGPVLVFLLFTSEETSRQSRYKIIEAAFRRSDSGERLVNQPDFPPLFISNSPTGTLSAEAKAQAGSSVPTEIEVKFAALGQNEAANTTSTEFADVTRTFPLPLGFCTVDPVSRRFTERTGGCPEHQALRQSFTIKNTGSDCLLINSVPRSTHFSVEYPTFPVGLGPNQSIEVGVAFSASQDGAFEEALQVNRTPARGDDRLRCIGERTRAESRISFDPPLSERGNSELRELNFCRVKFAPGQPESRTLEIKIRNEGEAPINIHSVALEGEPADSPFTVRDTYGTQLPCGSERRVSIEFRPPGLGEVAATLSVRSDAPGNPHRIRLKGAGCDQTPRVDLPPDDPTPLDFGEVEQGLRLVRYIRVGNFGGSPLRVTAYTEGPQDALFNLQPAEGHIGEALSEPAEFTVEPASPCPGCDTGPGEVFIGVECWANAPVGEVLHARLIVRVLDVNPEVNRSYELSARVTPTKPIEVALVLDRSHHMNDPLGDRAKIEAVRRGAELFVKLLRAGVPFVQDRVAVVSFNERPSVIREVEALTSAEQQQQIADDIDERLQPEGNTSIAGGILKATRLLAAAADSRQPGARVLMVVMTDGRDNRAYLDDEEFESALWPPTWPPPQAPPWYSTVTEWIVGSWKRVLVPPPPPDPRNPPDLRPRYKWVEVWVHAEKVPLPEDVKVFGIGLGQAENIDRGRMEGFCKDSGGLFLASRALREQQYFDLEKHAFQIYTDAAGMVLMRDPVHRLDAGSNIAIRLDLLAEDVKVLVVIYDKDGKRLPFTLVRPDGVEIEVSELPAASELRAGATDTSRFIEFRLPAEERRRLNQDYAWHVKVTHPGEYSAARNPSPSKPGFTDGKPLRSWTEPIEFGIAVAVASHVTMRPSVTGLDSTHPVLGEPLLVKAEITEGGKPLAGCHVTVVVTSPAGYDAGTLHLHRDTDEEGNKPGTHVVLYTDALAPIKEYGGTYVFTFYATGTNHRSQPFRREATVTKYVQANVSIEPRTERPPDSSDLYDNRAQGLYSTVRYVVAATAIGLMVIATLMLIAHLLKRI